MDCTRCRYFDGIALAYLPIGVKSLILKVDLAKEQQDELAYHGVYPQNFITIWHIDYHHKILNCLIDDEIIDIPLAKAKRIEVAYG